MTQDLTWKFTEEIEKPRVFLGGLDPKLQAYTHKSNLVLPHDIVS